MIPATSTITTFQDDLSSVIKNISGLKTWFRSDEGVVETSGKVSGWNDRSGNAINLSQPNDTFRPVYVTSGGINNLPYINCGIGPASTFLSFPDSSLSSMTSGEHFIIIQHNQVTTTNNGYGCIYNITAESTAIPTHIPFGGTVHDSFGATKRIMNVATISNVVCVQPLCYNSASANNLWFCYINGSLGSLTTTNNAGFSTTNNAIAGVPGTPAGYLYGKLYEHILFSRILTNIERSIINNYIHKRYRINFA